MKPLIKHMSSVLSCPNILCTTFGYFWMKSEQQKVKSVNKCNKCARSVSISSASSTESRQLCSNFPCPSNSEKVQPPPPQNLTHSFDHFSTYGGAIAYMKLLYILIPCCGTKQLQMNVLDCLLFCHPAYNQTPGMQFPLVAAGSNWVIHSLKLLPWQPEMAQSPVAMGTSE